MLDAGRSGMMLQASTSWGQNFIGGGGGRSEAGGREERPESLSAVSDSTFLVGGCGVGVGVYLLIFLSS